jgi:hypothetical protein
MPLRLSSRAHGAWAAADDDDSASTISPGGSPAGDGLPRHHDLPELTLRTEAARAAGAGIAIL